MAKIEAIPVRNFLKYSSAYVKDGLSGEHSVVFEDGTVINMHVSEIIVSMYFWKLIGSYNGLKLTSSYVVSAYYTNGMFTGKTHTKFLTDINRDLIYNVFVKDDNTIADNIAKFWYNAYDLLEALYSELSYMISDNVNSINISDLLEIQLDKDLMDAMEEVRNKPDVAAINKAHGIMDYIIRNKPEYATNPITKAYISGMINANQMKQVLGPRGYVTELDSSIFKYPIADSFTLGLSNLYSMAADSRSGAKALYLSNKAIQDSEYFGRELQLATMVVENLKYVDCGSTDYIDWYVKPPESSNGVVTYKGDLGNLDGKWYVNEKTGDLEVITPSMTHLYGKTIKLRSSIKCKLSNKKHVCTKCFGDLAYSIPKHANLGHNCSTEMNSKISQSILSTKHLVTSAIANIIVLDRVAKEFFSIKDKNGYVYIQPAKSKNVKISISFKQDECFGLKDIRSDKSINIVDPGRVSKLESITVIVTTNGKSEYHTIPVRVGNRYGIFELKFLQYVVSNGYSADEYDNYIVDMSKWKSITPILKLPEVEFSFLALSKDTKDMFKTMPIFKGGISKDSPESLLSKVFSLVNSKLDVNISLIEVVVYAFTVYDLPNNNYDLGRNSPNIQLSSLLTVINNRSAGASYGYNDLSGKIVTPSLFKDYNKPDHILDTLLLPNEVLNSLKQ